MAQRTKAGNHRVAWEHVGTMVSRNGHQPILVQYENMLNTPCLTTGAVKCMKTHNFFVTVLVLSGSFTLCGVCIPAPWIRCWLCGTCQTHIYLSILTFFFFFSLFLSWKQAEKNGRVWHKHANDISLNCSTAWEKKWGVEVETASRQLEVLGLALTYWSY